MDEKKMTLMERCINFMERDTRGIQIVTYGVTSVGLLIALYRIRPVSTYNSIQLNSSQLYPYVKKVLVSIGFSTFFVIKY